VNLREQLREGRISRGICFLMRIGKSGGGQMVKAMGGEVLKRRGGDWSGGGEVWIGEGRDVTWCQYFLIVHSKRRQNGGKKRSRGRGDIWDTSGESKGLRRDDWRVSDGAEFLD